MDSGEIAELVQYLTPHELEEMEMLLTQEVSAPTIDTFRPYLKILNKNQQLVPYIPNRVQAHYLAHRTGRDLILKPRQTGMSTCIVADTFSEAITRTVMGATLAHDDETTQKLR